MTEKNSKRLTRQDWLRCALQVLPERGVAGLKIVHLAKHLGATSGSFYWHFKDLKDLLDALLEYWEQELTDAIVNAARSYDGPPEQRIWNLMMQVLEQDAAAPDHAISVWARSDPEVADVYQRTLQKRFDFARWMFEEAGFEDWQASTRGRLMVAYLMGEFSTNLKANGNWKDIVQEEFEVLTNRSHPA